MAKLRAKVLLRALGRTDRDQALFINRLMMLSNDILAALHNENFEKAAREFLTLILPYSLADAVSMTGDEYVIAYVGYLEEQYPENCKIRTLSTLKTIADGKSRIVMNREDIGFPESNGEINAAIIEPVKVGSETIGTVKFYFKDPSYVTESQKSSAKGIALLLSTHMTSVELEKQRQLTAEMKLKLLQSQINPHFLFNTINTISSFTRKDPEKARELLREFSAFYRSTLEQSSESISLAQELKNAERYLNLQQARFGDKKLQYKFCVDCESKEDFEIPPFTFQPLVENAIKHGRDTFKKLTISLRVKEKRDTVEIEIEDDGKGMNEKTLSKLFEKKTADFDVNDTLGTKITQSGNIAMRQGGLGLAMSNVYERIKAFYGQKAEIKVESQEGLGTKILLDLPKVIEKEDFEF